MGKKDLHFFHIWSIPSTSSGNSYISRQQLDKQFNLEPQNIYLYQLTKHFADNIVPRISYALRDLGGNFDEYILFRSITLVGADRAGTADSCYGTKK